MDNLVKGIEAANFIIVGRAGMDVFTDPGVKVEDAHSMMVGLGGSAANIAAGLCKLGARAALVTCVSDDSVGAYCIGQLKRYGVDPRYVRAVGGEYRNSLAIYESVLHDHRNVIYRNGAADFQMTTDDVEAVDYGAYGALITAGTVFAAEPSRSAAFKALELAKAAGLPLIFDVDYRPYSWPSAEEASQVLTRAANMCDMIVGNDEEFGFVAGAYDKGLDKARTLAQTQGRVVIFKRGHEGATTFAGGLEIQTGIYEVEALKPVGAGDSFMAGLLSGIASGLDLEGAVLRGSACASITVSRPGCAPALPTQDDLDTFLQTHPGPSGD